MLARPSYLNFESGLLDKDCLFTFIIFHGHYLIDTHIYAMTEGFKIVSNLKISYEFWKVWSNYG